MMGAEMLAGSILYWCFVAFVVIGALLFLVLIIDVVREWRW